MSTENTQDKPATEGCATATGSALPRYYFSSAGYICDSQQSTRLGRLQDKERWREYGAVICEELNARPDNAAAIIEAWQTHLEPNDQDQATSGAVTPLNSEHKTT